MSIYFKITLECPACARHVNVIHGISDAEAGILVKAWDSKAIYPDADRCDSCNAYGDPSDDPTYGQQELSFFNGHYDNWCYLPAFAFITFHDTHGREEPEQHPVAAVLRPGNAAAALGTRSLLVRIAAPRLDRLPGVRLRVRVDGG